MALSQQHEDLLARAATHSSKSIVQWLEVANKVHDKLTVAQMLAESPEFFKGSYATALHCAAHHGHHQIAAQLLTESPEMAHVVDTRGHNALHCAADHGQDKVVAVLLSALPDLATTVDRDGATALHLAAKGGHDKVVAQLLAANPDLINAVSDGYNALHFAAMWGSEVVMEMLLAAKPDLIFGVADDGTTVLLLAADCHGQGKGLSKQLYARMLELYPALVRMRNADELMPFDYAVEYDYDNAIEAMQWSLTFDEILESYEKTLEKTCDERFRPIMQQQCESLVKLLNQDLLETVFEYLGFLEKSVEGPQRKKAKLCREDDQGEGDEDEGDE